MSDEQDLQYVTSGTQKLDNLEIGAEALQRQVGARVKNARKLQRIPRRVLSEISGVSPRYLAQIETGEGNLSIGLLYKIAKALGQNVEHLVSNEVLRAPDSLKIAALFDSASPEARAKALAALEDDKSFRPRGRRICLIGIRGAGKSTLGQAAGAALNTPFRELNSEIEELAGMPVSEVMDLYGQEGYRHLEAQALERTIENYDSLILAAAGGIVAEPSTLKTLLERFHTIWISAKPDEHMSRVRDQGDTRPMAGNSEAMDQLNAILKSREALYSQADAHLDTSGKSHEVSARELSALIKSKGYLELA